MAEKNSAQTNKQTQADRTHIRRRDGTDARRRRSSSVHTCAGHKTSSCYTDGHTCTPHLQTSWRPAHGTAAWSSDHHTDTLPRSLRRTGHTRPSDTSSGNDVRLLQLRQRCTLHSQRRTNQHTDTACCNVVDCHFTTTK